MLFQRLTFPVLRPTCPGCRSHRRLYTGKARSVGRAGLTSAASPESTRALASGPALLSSKPNFTCQFPGRNSVERSGQWTPQRSYALVEFRFGQSADSNRSKVGMPNLDPCPTISAPRLYRPAPVASGAGNGEGRGAGGNISEHQKAIGRRNIMCSTLQFGVASPGTTRNGKGDLRRRTSLTR
jgi:hypothetical protein